MQREVDIWAKMSGDYFPPPRLIKQNVDEFNELKFIIAKHKEFKKRDPSRDLNILIDGIQHEIGDLFFTYLCIANNYHLSLKEGYFTFLKDHQQKWSSHALKVHLSMNGRSKPPSNYLPIGSRRQELLDVLGEKIGRIGVDVTGVQAALERTDDAYSPTYIQSCGLKLQNTLAKATHDLLRVSRKVGVNMEEAFEETMISNWVRTTTGEKEYQPWDDFK